MSHQPHTDKLISQRKRAKKPSHRDQINYWQDILAKTDGTPKSVWQEHMRREELKEALQNVLQ